MSTIGHNSESSGQLRALIKRIERLESEKKEIAADIRDVYTEAKVNGLDPKIMRQIIRLRSMEKPKRDEMLAILDVYMHALGMAPADAVKVAGFMD